MPAGSNRMFVNTSTNARSGTPYCRPWLIEIAKASMMPARVEPCFETRRKISPGRPSSYSPTVTKPLQSATRNSNVRDWRVRGNFWRTGSRMMRSTICVTTSVGVAAVAAAAGVAPTIAASASFFVVESGCATLQLSR